jgi:hypothetical protein
MGKKLFLGAITIIAISLLFCGSSFANPPWASAEPGDATKKLFMEMEDKDKDGKVTEDECGCPENEFIMLDKNEDFMIDWDEAPSSAADVGQ